MGSLLFCFLELPDYLDEKKKISKLTVHFCSKSPGCFDVEMSHRKTVNHAFISTKLIVTVHYLCGVVKELCSPSPNNSSIHLCDFNTCEVISSEVFHKNKFPFPFDHSVIFFFVVMCDQANLVNKCFCSDLRPLFISNPFHNGNYYLGCRKCPIV